jgi:hypothetical protein
VGRGEKVGLSVRVEVPVCHETMTLAGHAVKWLRRLPSPFGIRYGHNRRLSGERGLFRHVESPVCQAKTGFVAGPWPEERTLKL